MMTIKEKDIDRVKKLLNSTPKTLKTLAKKTGFSRNKVVRVIDRLMYLPSLAVRYTYTREGERGCESVAYYV